MKDLDRTKKYDLSILNDEQLRDVLDWLKENDKGWDNSHIGRLKSSFCILHYEYGEWKLQTLKGNETNALELFKTDLMKQYDECYETDIYSDIRNLIEKGKQHGLKIVVTFEKL